MVSRVKFFAEYRKQIGLNADLIEVLDYNPKHLLTKSEISDKNIDKHVKELNQYEEKRNVFQKLYLKRKIIYFSIITIISLLVLALVIYFGIRVFD